MSQLPSGPKLLFAATITYAGLILFVCLHPIGRTTDMFDFKGNKSATITAMICMVATAATFVAASRGKTMTHGCLGSAIAFVTVMIGAFVDLTPESWTPHESQLFVRNLITASALPFVFVFLAGVWQSRR